MRQPTRKDILDAIRIHNENSKKWPAQEHDMNQDYVLGEVVKVEVKEIDFIRGFYEPCLWITFTDGSLCTHRYTNTTER